MRFVAKAVAVAAAATVLAGTPALAAPPELPAPVKPKFKGKIQPSLFGMHVHKLSKPEPGIDQKFGAIRIWDNGVRWDQVNTADGVYKWDLLGRVIANAEATGAQKIQYVLGSTPEWLATGDDESYLGPRGANSMPRDLEKWDAWVRAVVAQFGGSIDEYQIWNEVNFSSFWDGTPEQMVELTARASKIIRREDPSAEIVTGSAIVRQFKKKNKVSKQSAAVSTKSFFYNYLGGLKKRKVKFDAVGVHLYPWFKAGPGDGTPMDRQGGAAAAQRVLDHFKFKQPMYDTEMAYGNRRDNGWPRKVLSPSLGAAYLAQTYIFGMINNVPEVYWYGWDDYVLGVDVTKPDGTVLPPGIAYNTVMNWMVKAKNGGCEYAVKVNTCLIRAKGKRQYIVFRNTKSKKTYSVPTKWKVRHQCDVLGDCRPIKRKRVKVGISPLLLKR